ncbi:hypothetical protein FACS1894124_1190 [Spirochaetia bacterium]|nr:hypothetical protein FACS1894124_1190 [Spirochaetia bacterium]
MPRIALLCGLLIIIPLSLPAQEVLRGRVQIDMEPVYALAEGTAYPLDAGTARRRALEEASLFFSAMIYGWSFTYEIGEQARGTAENFELAPQGTIAFGDAGLFVTDADIHDSRFSVWADYRLSASQKRRVELWRAGGVRNLQAAGHAPLAAGPENTAESDEPAEMPGWIAMKNAALEDAAKAGIRAMLRSGERNRPKEARGFIALAEFPRYYLEAGQWAVSARFRAEITEIVPFAVY